MDILKPDAGGATPLAEGRRRELFAALVALELLSLLPALLIPERAADLHNAYGQLLIAGLTGAYFARYGLPRGREQRVFLAYCAWLLISRWLNRDFYLFLDRRILVDNLLAFLLLALGSTLDAPQRQRLLSAVTLVYALFFVLVSAAGIFVAVTGTYIHIPPENVWITILPSGAIGLKVRALNALSNHRLTNAARFYLAWWLLLIRLARVRKKGWYAPILLGMLLLHASIALCYSRTIRICFSVSCAMLALLLLLRRMRGRTDAKRVLALVLIPLVCLPLAYKSFDLWGGALNRLRGSIAPRFAAAYAAHPLDPEIIGLETVTTPEETETPAESAPEAEDSFTEQRSLAGNTTLTGRTDIWLSVFPSVRAKPTVLFYGQPKREIMPLANQFIPGSEYKNHMHNALVDCFMLTGLPGFLLALAWCVLLLIKMIRAFFARRAPLGCALLTIPLAGMLLYSMLEVVIFSASDVCGLLFFLLAGLFLAEYDTIPPRTAKTSE